jgi:dolichyl-phosphate beta-glucosyltransferase
MVSVSIIIPAYNEEKRIGKALHDIIQYFAMKDYEYEIIVVDDGSRDDTGNVVAQAGNERTRMLHNEVNKGKGYSVRKGMLNAKHDLVLFSDSDLATPIEELGKLLEQINNGYDIAIASRNLKDSRIVVNQPIYRQILGKAFPLVVRFVLQLKIKDTQCGFKLFRGEAAHKIACLQKIDGFAFDAEMLFLAKRLGYKVREVPVTWVDKSGSTVSPIKDGLRMLKDIIKIRANQLSGDYIETKP